MKILHTADWHLGKLIHGIYMTDDQRYYLRQVVDYLTENPVDVILIAGDLFDRAIPPIEAIELYDSFIKKVVLELKIPIIAIGGNHDSPARLNFGRQLMQHQGYHIISEFDPQQTPIILSDQFGPVHFHPIPYIDPATIRHTYQDETIRSFDDAYRAVMAHLQPQLTPSARHVAIAHAFVIHSSSPKPSTSDSERPLTIGGSEYVSADHFTPFHYTALGHLHQGQRVGSETIRYSGSLLKYSLSEQHHQKGMLLIELDGSGVSNIEPLYFTPRRDLRAIRGVLNELLQLPPSEDYIFATLLDNTPILQPMEQIRSVFPNAMHVRRDLQKVRAPEEDLARLKTLEKSDDITLFTGFFETVLERTPDEKSLSLFQSAMEALYKEEQ